MAVIQRRPAAGLAALGALLLVTETWTIVSNGTYEGSGVNRARADGSLQDSEDLRLLAMGGQVFYVAKVAHN